VRHTDLLRLDPKAAGAMKLQIGDAKLKESDLSTLPPVKEIKLISVHKTFWSF
jgi:hypothetical protein